MTKLEFLDKINDILIGLNTAESDALGSLYDELMRSQWIPVEKELPSKRKDQLVISDKVLIRTTGGDCLSAEYDYQDKEWIDVYNIETLESNKVTHWMPLPEEPRKEDKK